METGLRTRRERIIQTLAFEASGLLVVAPLCAAVSGEALADSFGLLVGLSLVAMAWSAGFNGCFDRIERVWTGRIASDRPQPVRMLHALLHEASTTCVTCPLIVAATALEWREALAADLGLAAVYALHGWLFHWLFDRLRPVDGVPLSSAACNAS